MSQFDPDTHQVTALAIAEETVLGSVIERPALAGRLFGRVQVGDFTGPRQDVAAAIHGMRTSAPPIPVDFLNLLTELQKRGQVARLPGGAAYLHDLAARAAPDVLDWHVTTVVNEVRRRNLFALGTQVAHRAQQAEQDPAETAAAVIPHLQSIVDAAEVDASDILVPTLGQFLNVEDDPYDWVLEGLLERGDRMVLTGEEGLGKSVLLRQLAVCAAGGVHPFNHSKIKPLEVLVIDCENTPVQSRRRYRGLAQKMREWGTSADDRLRIECRPEGLDLGKLADEAWLVRTVANIQPALLVIGPIYRLHAGNPNDEEQARHVARVLDRCRAAANCALIVEAHSPHGDTKQGGTRALRPVGSSLWLRWPEFGYGLARSSRATPTDRLVELRPWRGDRDARYWPPHLRNGGDLPWKTYQPSQEGWER